MKPSHLLLSVALFVAGSWVMTSAQAGAWFALGVVFWVMGGGVFALVWLGVFWSERARYYDSKAAFLHETRDMDIDRLAALGFVASDVRDRVRVDLYADTSSRHFDLPVSLAKLRILSAGLLDGRPFTSREWSGVLSDSEIRALRGAMRSRGMIEPVSEKDTRQGFRLTDAGRAVFAQLLPSPTEPEGV